MNQEKADVSKILRELEECIAKYNFGERPDELYDPIRYFMSLGGKRVRPLLTLLSYLMYKEDYAKILVPAAAVEVFHNFTLLHDDIMDNAPLRRGKPTVHEKWNSSVAILSGDVMLVKAYDMMLEVDKEILGDCLHIFNRTAAEVCEGQQFDMNFESQDDIREDAYLEMIRQKTAVLLGFSLQFGAMLAGAPKEDADKLYAFGVNIGLGFQLMDDLLDVFADEKKFGKQIGGDIISNKKTFLLIKAKELARGETLKELNYWLRKKDFDKVEKVQSVKQIYHQLGIKELTEQKIRFFFDEGFRLFESIEVPRMQAFDQLYAIVDELISREK